jgi:hypothetical protein
VLVSPLRDQIGIARNIFIPQVRVARLGIGYVAAWGVSMKDVRAVLLDKEQDLQRVRREIQALLVVIPLLAQEPSFSNNVLTPAATLLPAQIGMEAASKPPQKERFSQLLISWLSESNS